MSIANQGLITKIEGSQVLLWIQEKNLLAFKSWVHSESEDSRPVGWFDEPESEMPWVFVCLKLHWVEGLEVLLQDLRVNRGVIQSSRYNGCTLLHWIWMLTMSIDQDIANRVARLLIRLGANVEARDTSLQSHTITAGDWTIRNNNVEGLRIWCGALTMESLMFHRPRCEELISTRAKYGGLSQEMARDMLNVFLERECQEFQGLIKEGIEGRIHARL